jgi:nucleoside-diphosphate-sugar epimerase
VSRIFFTGATGYLGRVLARRLAADGHELRAVVRVERETSDRAALEELDALGVTLFAGDVTDRYSLREAMSGADWVRHLAAAIDAGTSDETMRAVNVAGSEAVASLAYKLGVGRMLAVSSIAAFGGSPADGTPATEETPPQEPYTTLYGATKREGELAVRSWADRGLATNIVYPSLIYGPPGKERGSNQLLDALDRGAFPALVGADRLSTWVFVDDVVDGIARVMERSEPGRDFLLSGEVVSVEGLAAKVHAHGGAKPPRVKLPVGLARVGAGLARPLLGALGVGEGLPPADQLASLARHWAFDDSRARRELDWRPRGLDAGLPPTLELLRRTRGDGAV